MPSSAPLVTVGMAVFNGERYIAEAVRSIQGENYSNWELLAVSDCSQDASVEILKSFNDPRIRIIENAMNIGLVGVRNLILREARGEYVAWLDQDDVTKPDRLSTQVAFLEAHPDYSVCGAWTQTFTEQSDGRFQSHLDRLPRSYKEVRASMLFLNPMACNTVTMRAKAFTERGLSFQEEFGNSLDYDLWSRASDTSRIFNIPRALGAYRIHGGQTSQGSALEKMNVHALQVQTELASRSLGIEMTDIDRTWHSAATVYPTRIHNAEDLDYIAAWFARLRSTNLERRAFAIHEFDVALARQWTTVLLGSINFGVVGPSLANRAFSGLRQIGIPIGPAIESAFQGLNRRLSRRSNG